MTNYQFRSQVEVDSKLAIQIKVIGVCSGGNHAVELMVDKFLVTGDCPGVEFFCTDTAESALSTNTAPRLIQLGIETLGTTPPTQDGRWIADHAGQDIRTAINGAHILFVITALDGITGSGAAVVIARLAREMGILTVVATITQPCGFDDASRMSCADTYASLNKLEVSADALIVTHDADVLDKTSDQAQIQGSVMLADLVRDIAIVVNVAGYVGVDFEDIRTVLGQAGKALIGSGLSRGPERVRNAVEQALMSPLFFEASMTDADRVLVLISASEQSFKLPDCKFAMNAIRSSASPEAHVIYGTTFDDELGDAIRVTVIATGLGCRDA